jgi:hypothetical protein
LSEDRRALNSVFDGYDTKGARLCDVRTAVEVPGYRFPAALRIMARTNQNLHIFEYRGETFYTHESHDLMEATIGVEQE